MTILSTDIKLLESERMRDTQDGGGRMTGNEIPDGVAGNVFPKVSRLDSVYGRVNLRKLYAAVMAANTDVYAGAHAIITDPPNNEKIRCLLFSTGSHFDTRQEARDRIESYVVAGPESRWFLYGNQIVGQKAITLFARPDEPLPDVGDVLCLSAESGAMAGTQQYVRITDVESEVRTFDTGETTVPFERRVVTCKIGDPLRYTFTGDLMTVFSRHSVSTAALVRETQVADASRYYGIQPLAASASAGALALTLPSVYDNLVPSATRESAVSLASISDAVPQLACAVDPVAIVVHRETYPGYDLTWTMPTAIQPGSLRVKIQMNAPATQGLGWIDFDADGAGYVGDHVYPPLASWMLYNDLYAAEADYAAGTVRVHLQDSFWDNTTSYVEIHYIPIIAADHPAHTEDTPITLGTRGTVYTGALTPLPAPGTLIVDYRSLGRWYRLRDDGAGQLVGNDASVGTGSVDYVTGAYVVTLGALPDVGSSILRSWGTPAHYEVLATDTQPVTKDFQLADYPIKPDSVSVSWEEGGVAKTATDNAAGVVTGATATGMVDYATGKVRMTFTRAPDDEVAIGYDKLTDVGTQVGDATVYEAGHAIQPYSIQVEFGGTDPAGETFHGLCSDDGVGNLRMWFSWGASDNLLLITANYGLTVGSIVGSVNYSTGTITLNGSVAAKKLEWSEVLGTWARNSSAGNFLLMGTNCHYANSAAFSSETYSSGPGIALDIRLAQAEPMTIVPGSVVFDAAGRTYVDRNGTLYTDIDWTTGSGLAAGSIDYDTGETELTVYNADQALNLTIKSCLGRYGEWTMSAARFRTPGSPVRPASFYVQATTPGGDLLTVTADTNGDLSGSVGVTGAIEQTMGVAAVDWGQSVLPSTLRYSCVVQTSLPLDADLLGIDPVRLPSDGRVAIFRPGDVAVVHDTQLYTLPNPAVASAIYNVGRTDLSLLELIDADGDDVPAAKYIADLAAGTVTMAADLDLTGYTQPLKARHRVEDMVLIADAQITGEIALTAPTTHAYTSASYLSSALLFGDLQAYVTTLFDQQTWTGIWSDVLIGSQANAEYDDINHPIEVLNESAVKERWRLNFTSSTAYQVYGENLGLIATGDTSTDLAPINPVTGDPYFVLRAAGWGAGWAAGVNLRFNTQAGSAPIWIARTILAGATLEGDSFDLAVRGDVD